VIFRVLVTECQWYHEGCAIRATERVEDRLLSADRDRAVVRFVDASINTEPTAVVGTAVAWDSDADVDDEKSAVTILTDEVVTDTVAMVVDTVVSWGLATDVDDDYSAAAITTDQIVTDTVAMIVDTVVSWGVATDVEDDDSAAATLAVDEAVHLIPSTTVDDNSRTPRSSVTTDNDDVEEPEVAVVIVASSETEITMTDVHLDNVCT
jgi:hypothetical protein